VLRRTLPLVGLVLLLAGPAGAGTVRVGIGVVRGKLRISASAATATAAGTTRVRVTVADARGNGRGWTLGVVAARPVAVVAVSAQCAAGSTCTLPTAVRPRSGVALQAARGTGMGVVELVVTLGKLPAGSPPTAVHFTLR
jgi:hypothetical protein